MTDAFTKALTAAGIRRAPPRGQVQCTVRNVWTAIAGLSDAQEAGLDALLRVTAPGYWFSDAYRRRVWDGKVPFLHKATTSLTWKVYTGLLPLVIRFFQATSVDYVVHDERGHGPTFETTPLALHGIALRADQSIAVQVALSNRINTHGDNTGISFPRVVLKAPTGTGKTVMAAALCKQILGRCVILVHRKELLYQTGDALSKMLGEQVGLIGDGNYDLSYRVTVASVQTLAPNLKGLTEFLFAQDALIMDEAHHYGKAKQFEKVAAAIPAFVRIACSATPWDADDAPTEHRLMGLSGPLLDTGKAGKFIADGVLAPVTVEYKTVTGPAQTFIDGRAVDLKDLPWGAEVDAPNAYDAGIVRNLGRNITVVSEAIKESEAGKTTLVLTSRVEHGRSLAAMCNGAPFLSGDEDSATRASVLDAFRNGTVKLLVATTIFDEGVNVPDIECLILAGAGKSVTQTLQRIGRGMRKKVSGRGLRVVDFLDKQHPILLRHSRARQKTCREAGFIVRDMEG